MAITEEKRHKMYQALERELGSEEAATLMEHLPPVGWADVATKRDLDQMAMATKRDLDQMAVATKRDLDQMAMATKRDLDQMAMATKRDLDQMAVATKRDLDEFRTEFDHVRAEIAHFAAVLRAEIAASESRMEAKLERGLREQTRLFLLGLVGSNATIAGLAFAAASLV
ncbi:MAG: hypothetical protein ACRD29_17205 [Acidimicrobiales bacterium]